VGTDAGTVAFEGTVLTAWTGTVLRALDSRGLDGTALAARAGIPADALACPTRRIPLRATTRLWELAVEATGDPAFGLEVSRHVRPTTFQALGQAFLASECLADALDRVARYCRVTADVADARVETLADEVVVVIGRRPGAARPADEAIDAIVATLVRSARFLLGRETDPTRVLLERPAPPPPAAGRFADFFGCTVQFEAGHVALAFDRAVAQRPISGGSDELARLSDDALITYLAHIEHPTTAEQVRATLRPRLPEGEPHLADVARVLHLSSRSLQRALTCEGTSYRALLQEVRRDVALGHLRQGRSVTETAGLLGFRDTAAFSRAFKQWTGCAPTRLA
jgi:AraC-like DNA-binding protein